MVTKVMGYEDRPRQGEYGDTTQRCAWCGRPTDDLSRCLYSGPLNHYCSFSCKAAGDYKWHIGCSFCVTFVFITLTLIALQLTGIDPRIVSQLLPFGVVAAIGWGLVIYGYWMRRDDWP